MTTTAPMVTPMNFLGERSALKGRLQPWQCSRSGDVFCHRYLACRRDLRLSISRACRRYRFRLLLIWGIDVNSSLPLRVLFSSPCRPFSLRATAAQSINQSITVSLTRFESDAPPPPPAWCPTMFWVHGSRGGLVRDSPRKALAFMRDSFLLHLYIKSILRDHKNRFPRSIQTYA